MEENNKIQLFEGTQVRYVWDAEIISPMFPFEGDEDNNRREHKTTIKVRLNYE